MKKSVKFVAAALAAGLACAAFAGCNNKEKPTARRISKYRSGKVVSERPLWKI